jgi:hypothetical protein
MLARAPDRCKGARRRTGCDRDRIDARYRVADDRCAPGRRADVRSRGAFCATYFAELGDVAGDVALPMESIAKIIY